MDIPGQKLLAGAALSFDQNGGGCAGHSIQHLEHSYQTGVLRQDRPGNALPDRASCIRHSFSGGRRQLLPQLLGRKRLHDKIDGSHPHCVDSLGNGPERRHQNDAGGRADLTERFEEGPTVDFRHAQVADHPLIGSFLLHTVQGFLPVLRPVHMESIPG